MKHALIYLAMLIGLFVASSMAHGSPIAEIVCHDTEVLRGRLHGHYGTMPHAVALRSPETSLEIWRAEDGDWALVERRTTGLSCLLAMGEAWTDLGPALQSEG
jgi:hypothetical protein